MTLSYLIITFNRRDGLLGNLREIYSRDPAAKSGSSTTRARMARPIPSRDYPRIRLILLEENIGMPARNVALRQMTSEFVAIVDDDSHPLDSTLERSIQYMHATRMSPPSSARAVLPDGRSEASALPSILLGCASCVRLSAVREVGYFPDDFFRQAEEYDLSCRLWNAGHRIVRFEDLTYRHDKNPSASRASRAVMALDLKHNLIVARAVSPQGHGRCLSPRFHLALRRDDASRRGMNRTSR